MNKYKTEKIKVIDIWHTDLSKKDLELGETVIFINGAGFKQLSTVFKSLSNDSNQCYVFKNADSSEATIPYYEDVIKSRKERNEN